jgi:hypothetical protein
VGDEGRPVASLCHATKQAYGGHALCGRVCVRQEAPPATLQQQHMALTALAYLHTYAQTRDTICLSTTHSPTLVALRVHIDMIICCR